MCIRDSVGHLGTALVRDRIEESLLHIREIDEKVERYDRTENEHENKLENAAGQRSNPSEHNGEDRVLVSRVVQVLEDLVVGPDRTVETEPLTERDNLFHKSVVEHGEFCAETASPVSYTHLTLPTILTRVVLC